MRWMNPIHPQAPPRRLPPLYGWTSPRLPRPAPAEQHLRTAAIQFPRGVGIDLTGSGLEFSHPATAFGNGVAHRPGFGFTTLARVKAHPEWEHPVPQRLRRPPDRRHHVRPHRPRRRRLPQRRTLDGLLRPLHLLLGRVENGIPVFYDDNGNVDLALMEEFVHYDPALPDDEVAARRQQDQSGSTPTASGLPSTPAADAPSPTKSASGSRSRPAVPAQRRHPSRRPPHHWRGSRRRRRRNRPPTPTLPPVHRRHGRHGRKMMLKKKWAVGSGQWAVNAMQEESAVGIGQWAVNAMREKWAVGSGQWAVNAARIMQCDLRLRNFFLQLPACSLQPPPPPPHCLLPTAHRLLSPAASPSSKSSSRCSSCSSARWASPPSFRWPTLRRPGDQLRPTAVLSDDRLRRLKARGMLKPAVLDLRG